MSAAMKIRQKGGVWGGRGWGEGKKGMDNGRCLLAFFLEAGNQAPAGTYAGARSRLGPRWFTGLTGVALPHHLLSQTTRDHAIGHPECS